MGDADARCTAPMAAASRPPQSRWGGWEVGTTSLLAVLVGLSLALSGVLWLSTPPLPAPVLASGAAAYLIGDTVGRSSLATLLDPARIVMLYPGGSGEALGDPAANPLFGVLWSASVRLLAGIDAARLAAAQPVGLQEVAARVAAAGSGAATAALEIDLGPTLTLAQWMEWFDPRMVWRGAQGPPLSRIYVITFRRETEVVLVSGYTALRVMLPAAAGRSLSTLLSAQMGQPQPSGYSVRPLARTPGATFGVEPGIEVPQQPDWAAVRLGEEQIDSSRLAAAIFPDPLAVHVFREPGGSVQFTDPQHWVLSVDPSFGTAQLQAVGAGTPGNLDWLQGLRYAVQYIGRAGGWPLSGWLSSAVPSYAGGTCTLGACTPTGYRYNFATRYEGLPVMGGVPALSVSVEGAGAGVTDYARAVAVPGAVAGGPSSAWIPAATALAALEADPPPSLYSPSMVVTGVSPAWVPLPLAGLLEPAWAFSFTPLDGGEARLVLVDALHGEVLDVLSNS